MMTNREINMLVEDYITTGGGYLNHFSYSTHEAFYHTHCDLDVDVAEYRARGLTTRKAFIQILKDSQPRDQAKIIRGTFDYLPPPKNPLSDEDKKRKASHELLLAAAVRLEANGQVQVPADLRSTETVLEALRDAETLLEKRGPKNAVDRAHTALHGYHPHQM